MTALHSPFSMLTVMSPEYTFEPSKPSKNDDLTSLQGKEEARKKELP
jgi:hypothetical protein